MNCSNHMDREPIGMCVRCNKLICKECAVKINNKYYCKECVSEMYSDNSSRNNINTERVREYADKAVNVTKDVTNEALNLVKDFSGSEEFKSTVNKAKANHKEVNYILAIIAILLLSPKLVSSISNLPYLFEDLFFSFRYYGVLRSIFYLISIVATFIQPLVIIALASLLFNNFMKLKKNIRMIAPVIIVAVFIMIRFISANIAFTYFSFHIIGEIFSYIIPVGLIVIGSYLDKE
ncbi:B-box zinc finger protein [Clostridium sp. D43t1_170807_H7]|uniref:B-box zinc finger protein n=1 Tax=Clostridium sp. D43t1_170807_H7 TaxID=2787140 RepID=UPI00189AB69E|nr:B-box zinc finger protein [Clostridium sp. D43t1_170807_H7]